MLLLQLSGHHSLRL